MNGKKLGNCEVSSNGYISFLELFYNLSVSLYTHKPLNDRNAFLRNASL